MENELMDLLADILEKRRKLILENTIENNDRITDLTIIGKRLIKILEVEV